jgi:hypothetical protein
MTEEEPRARRERLAREKFEAAVQRTVDEAPPLTDEQIARLRQLLLPSARARVDAPVRLNIGVKP